MIFGSPESRSGQSINLAQVFSTVVELLGHFDKEALNKPFDSSAEFKQHNLDQQRVIQSIINQIETKLSTEPKNKALLNAREQFEFALDAKNMSSRIKSINQGINYWNNYVKYS